MSAISMPWGVPGFARPRTVEAATPRLTNLAFGALLAALGVLGLASVLTINVLMTEGAFQEAELKSRVRTIEAAQQRAQQTLSVLASPGSLESRARAMGMVPVETPVFLRLADGRVIGAPSAAKAVDAPQSVQWLAPSQSLLAPELQTAPAASTVHTIAPTSDAAVEIRAGVAP